jgi:hypothetical protein
MKSRFGKVATRAARAAAAVIVISIAGCSSDAAQDEASVPTEPQTIDQGEQAFHPDWSRRRPHPPVSTTTSSTTTGTGGTSTPPTPPPACVEFGKACGVAACCPGLTCHFDGYTFWCRF